MALLGLKSVDRTLEKSHLVQEDKLSNSWEGYHLVFKGGENYNNTQTQYQGRCFTQTSLILGVQIKLEPGTAQWLGRTTLLAAKFSVQIIKAQVLRLDVVIKHEELILSEHWLDAAAYCRACIKHRAAFAESEDSFHRALALCSIGWIVITVKAVSGLTSRLKKCWKVPSGRH